jgi:hypothetical protein
MMRGFSSSIHHGLIASRHGWPVQQPFNVPRANLALLVAATLGCGVLLGGAAASLGGPEPTPGLAPVAATTSPSPSPSLATSDVPGEDIDRLPRMPGSVRTAHEVLGESGFQLTANEYHVAATVDAVRAFYQGVIVDHGWERADINFAKGEWSYILIDQGTEALIEIEELGGLVEIDLQVSEPIPSRTSAPELAPPAPVPSAATTPVAPPPPPPPGGGDDDDGDDDDDDDSVDEDGGTDDDD